MYDIFFVGKTSPQWQKLKSRFPTARQVLDFYEAQRLSMTKMFWIVWPDLEIEKSFDFLYDCPTWDQKYIHVFKNQNTYNGVTLFPKRCEVSNSELETRIFLSKKEIDTVASMPIPYDIFEIDTYDEYLTALETSTTEMFWISSKNITAIIPEDFNTSSNIDKSVNHAFVHQLTDQNLYNGLFLCSKKVSLSRREIEYRFIINRKEWNIIGSKPKRYDIFEVNTYNDYVKAIKKSSTNMFWAIRSGVRIDKSILDMYFSHDNVYDNSTNHTFLHKSNDNTYRNSVWLLSKKQPLTKQELKYRILNNAKDWDIIASYNKPYDTFTINTYDDYKTAIKTSTSDMFWAISNHVKIIDSEIAKVDYSAKNCMNGEYDYERSNNHTYLHKIEDKTYPNYAWLLSKKQPLTKQEIKYRTLQNAIVHDTIVSEPRPYDKVFISYQELTADENYARILEKFPDCKRVHGVKGIHQAHIAAAKLCSTPMFWIIDGDAQLVDDFNFEYPVQPNFFDHVHVWRSINPINGLVYGYGGIKLFPTQLTIDMDTSKPDMTTSISNKFKAVDCISNITAFNSDPFSTWRSAFRECVKLSSKVIDRQKDNETNKRLNTWCTVGEDRQFGSYAIRGAIAGTAYGIKNQGNLEALKKINDFGWLKEQFNARNI